MHLSLANSHLLLSLCLSCLIFWFGAFKKRETNGTPGKQEDCRKSKGNGQSVYRRGRDGGWFGWHERRLNIQEKRDPHLTLLQILSYPLVGAREEKSSLSLWGSWRRSQGRNSFQNLFCSAQWTGPFVWPYSDAVDRSNKERFQCTSL